MYGSSAARALYGQGDFQTRTGYAGGYYAAGGFFSGLKKLAKKATTFATKTVVGKALVGAIPGVGGIVSAANILQGGIPALMNAAKPGAPLIKTPSMAQLTSSKPGGAVKLGAFGTRATGKRRRKKTSARRRRSAPRRRSRSKRGRGDYGDDWSGNTPSRAKGTGQFLTRAGGRRRYSEPPRRRRRRRGSRRPGTQVSFTTKDGRRVSFTAR